MSASGDMAADLVEMKLHGFGVGERQRQRRTGPALRADGAEGIGALVALVSGPMRPCSALGPLSDNSVLLSDPGLILEPALDGLAPRQAER
jgi:hypothetical protein